MAEEEKKEALKKEAEVTEETTLLDDIVQATRIKPADDRRTLETGT